MKKIVRQIIRMYRSISRRVNKILITSQLNSVGKKFQCDQNVIVYDGHNISIGNNVVLNRGVLLQSCEGAKISIGNNVVISFNSLILTGGLKSKEIVGGIIESHIGVGITIGNNVWIGANSIILPGVNICSNIVIAAGTIVNKSIDKEGVYAGTPAKFVKEIN